MSATAQGAIGISAFGLDVQAFEAFGKHHRIVIEHAVLDARSGSSGM